MDLTFSFTDLLFNEVTAQFSEQKFSDSLAHFRNFMAGIDLSSCGRMTEKKQSVSKVSSQTSTKKGQAPKRNGTSPDSFQMLQRRLSRDSLV